MNRREKKIKSLSDHCAYCGSKQDLTIDHIIPQAMCNILGVDRNKRQNLQVLCQPCNNKKGDSLKSNDIKTVQLLETMIAQWKFLHAPQYSQRNYVFRNLPVRSLTPEPTYFWVGSEKQQKQYELQKIYIKQKLGLIEMV